MVGEIHGIISREDAWHMWKPYGERLQLDGHIDIAGMDTDQFRMIREGASDESIRQMGELYKEVRSGVQGRKSLSEFLLNEQATQQLSAEQRREHAYMTTPEYLRRLGRAAQLLVNEKILVQSEADAVQDWLFAPDGNPVVQYTPMSRLEYGRVVFEQEGVWPTAHDKFTTDFSTGTIWSTTSSRLNHDRLESYNRVHESVHAYLTGLELYDITTLDGARKPRATVFGVLASTPSVEVRGNDFVVSQNWELTEGWTDFITRELIRLDPALGQRAGVLSYDGWVNVVHGLRNTNPNLFRMITSTMFVVATPGEPTAKRDAVREMHSYVDRAIGRPNSLSRMLRKAGGTMGMAVGQKAA